MSPALPSPTVPRACAPPPWRRRACSAFGTPPSTSASPAPSTRTLMGRGSAPSRPSRSLPGGGCKSGQSLWWLSSTSLCRSRRSTLLGSNGTTQSLSKRRPSLTPSSMVSSSTQPWSPSWSTPSSTSSRIRCPATSDPGSPCSQAPTPTSRSAGSTWWARSCSLPSSSTLSCPPSRSPRPSSTSGLRRASPSRFFRGTCTRGTSRTSSSSPRGTVCSSTCSSAVTCTPPASPSSTLSALSSS
mmetsp:Transcript_8072/g.27022  ORF Transcript_8072/g.27022 Transcript_8072/m.27022 type:complete len:242 (+) Transcript_8072:2499-3224(+)